MFRQRPGACRQAIAPPCRRGVRRGSPAPGRRTPARNMSGSPQRTAAEPMRMVSPRWTSTSKRSPARLVHLGGREDPLDGVLPQLVGAEPALLVLVDEGNRVDEAVERRHRGRRPRLTSAADPAPRTARASSPDRSLGDRPATISSQRNCRAAPGGAERTRRTSDGHPPSPPHPSSSSPSCSARAAISVSVKASSSLPTSETCPAARRRASGIAMLSRPARTRWA